MAGTGPIRQDWELVEKDEKAVNAECRSGAEIETMKKCKSFCSFGLTPSSFFSSKLTLGFRFHPFRCRLCCTIDGIRRLGFPSLRCFF